VFKHLSDECLQAISKLCQARTYQPGEWILEEGFPARNVLLIEDGQVDLSCKLDDGREAPVGTLGAGDLLGWSAFLPPHRLTASAAAKTTCALVEVDAEGLRTACGRDSRLGYDIIWEVARALSRRLEMTRRRLAMRS
jgi:CRP/FNR family cyclic AMP-dependent transcriptional regulator